MTPKLALRVAIIGGAALALFAIVFFRLWYLQILSGEEFRAEANANRVREIKVQAPRGEIVDRDGRVLVGNRVGLSVKLSPSEIPERPGARDRLYERLSTVVGTPSRRIERRVEEGFAELPFSSATVEQDVDLERVSHILENQEDFPGVTVERVFLRSYPRDELAAHVFGHVGEVNAEQLEEETYQGVEPGDIVGQAGIEAVYDRFLRGENGASRMIVDAHGDFVSEASVVEPEQGNQLRLALDSDVQETGQEVISGSQAAFVVMDVESGEVVGLGSSPSFDPGLFTGGIEDKDYERLVDEDNGAPLTNRAIASVYPTGSTWKLVTATAALEEGILGLSETLVDDGGHTNGQFFSNAGGASYGPLQLPRALQVSSDDFFYQLGDRANSSGDGQAIQKWAARFGFGKPTGIDLPGESGGLVPSPEWRNQLYRESTSEDSPGGEEVVAAQGETDRGWSVGDNINLAIGQGDLQATPLQLAVAYAAVANGGTVVEPHLGLEIQDPEGRPVQQIEPEGVRTLDIDPEYRAAMMDGLYRAANLEGGTSASVFADFPIEIAGKTGTAETAQGDQSWYAAIAPYDDPKYVAVATFEEGGFGAETAAPAVRQILAALFEVEEKPVEGGEARD
ncbi:MAG TPA: penicillin-binding protein 2 [Thermoleophilaceae bacterium]|nr:penicillin-binding protein 2 [Thermoleophilaceae bacterium]